MDSRLLHLLPTEQARCREIAGDYTTMGSIGCFAAALIEQALRRADRAIIEGGEDSIRDVLRELQAVDPPYQRALAKPTPANLPGAALPRLAMAPPPMRHRDSALQPG